jgi:hypothetical protein
MQALEALASTHQECAKTLVELRRPRAHIGLSREQSCDELLMLPFCDQCSVMKHGGLTIGLESWIHGILQSRIVSVGTLPGLPEHGPIMRRRRRQHIVEIAERDYGIRRADGVVIASVNSAYGEPVSLRRAPAGPRRQPPRRGR